MRTTTETAETMATMATMADHDLSDIELQQAVLDEFARDEHVRVNEIGVVVRDGIVTLFGVVDSYLTRMAAQDAAHRVREVRAVANEITVRLPGFAERTDEDIARAATNALTWDAAIPAGQIEVSVTEGWVTLRGEVETAAQHESAERGIRCLTGVQGITDMITVSSAPQPADVHRLIEHALVRSVLVDAHSIAVEVVGTVAILRGTVHSQQERQAAESTALATPGITAVESAIVVDLQLP